MWYKNGIVFNSQQAIRLDNPNTSLPLFMSDEMIESLGYVEVIEAEKPSCTEVQYLVDGNIELIDDVPIKGWKVVDKFSDTAEYTEPDGTVHPAMTKSEYEALYYANKVAVEVAEAKSQNKAELVRQLEVLTVTTSYGNTFDANAQAKLDMQNGIEAARTTKELIDLGLLPADTVWDKTVWRLANDSEITITLLELKEASMLAVKKYAEVKGIAPK